METVPRPLLRHRHKKRSCQDRESKGLDEEVERANSDHTSNIQDQHEMRRKKERGEGKPDLDQVGNVMGVVGLKVAEDGEGACDELVLDDLHLDFVSRTHKDLVGV
jgi:hypothetical protein